MIDPPKINSDLGSRRYWPLVSVVLLILYLAFFHLCLGASYGACIAIGITCWIIWLTICWKVKAVFANRFEYWIHQLVGLDILFEGFSPLHEGLGFYYCAASFWAVFLIYHYAFALYAKPATQPLASDDPDVTVTHVSSL